ncbi:MAG: hypothetical protein PHD76_10110 [Methylacidiphilales bacterium]|nr:hypothetical protein [Candidatus Methylacidiphilales bacterium]
MKEGGYKAPEPSDLNGHVIIGLGSAGVNIVDQIILEQRNTPGLFCFDTDEQGIRGSVVGEKMLLGSRRVRGLGAGGDPSLGAEIAREEAADIRAMLQGARTAIVTLGLGGGTGSGMALEFIRILKQLGAQVLVVAVAPFDFEGKRRLGQAQETVSALKNEADLVFCLSNGRLLHLHGQDADVRQNFATMNSMMGRCCMNLRSMLCQRSPMQIHLSDLKNLAAEHDCGSATLENCWVGFGRADGQERVREVVDEVLSSPLFHDGKVWSKGSAVVASLSGAEGMSMGEFQAVVEYLKQEMPVELPVLAGTVLDAEAGDSLNLTLLVTGQAYDSEEAQPKKKAAQEFVFESKPAALETKKPKAAPIEAVSDEVAQAARSRKKAPVQPVLATVSGEVPNEEHAEDADAEIEPTKRPRQTEQKYFIQQDELPLDKKTFRGRFEKAAPTMFNGQDLDQPTFMRLNIKVRL